MKRLYKFEHTFSKDKEFHGLMLAQPSEIEELIGRDIEVLEANPQHGSIGFTITRDMIEEIPVPMIEYIEWLELELMSDDRESVLGGAEPGDSFGFDPREHVM